MPLNIPEERRSRLHRGGSLKSREIPVMLPQYLCPFVSALYDVFIMASGANRRVSMLFLFTKHWCKYLKRTCESANIIIHYMTILRLTSERNDDGIWSELSLKFLTVYIVSD
jgi:hypothetical protein